MSVFSTTAKRDSVDRQAFFDDPVTIARYDKQKYNIFEKLTDKQLGFFWRPEEIDCTRDSKDFKALTTHEKHIFTSNLKRQILLDSVQGRAPVLAFGPICSLPELETWITTWTFFETIHSRSYTHIIRNVYSDPSKVFDEMMDIAEIADCAKDISKYYDDLILDANAWVRMHGFSSVHRN
jgi:ribonucleoside-diphosphate reductase beta chain